MKTTTHHWVLSLLLLIITSSAMAQTPLPYTFDFSNADLFKANWKVIDANKDAKTWIIESGQAKYPYHRDNAGDDWMFTPKFALEAGKSYKITYFVKTGSGPENLKVTLGKDTTAAAQTTVLFDLKSYKNSSGENKTMNLTVSETGTYYIGFYCYSTRNQYYVNIDNFKFEEILPLPVQISDLTVTPGVNGTLSSVLSWTNPSKDQINRELKELSGVKIYRGTDLVHTFATDIPGAAQTWTDNPTTAGVYKYKAVAYNVNGEAPGTASVVTSTWIGEDVPAAVTAITATGNENSVSINFTPPVIGKNGGWINSAAITYKIVRNPGNVVLETAYAGSLPYLDAITNLGVYSYSITPATPAGIGESASSGNVIAGNAKDIPYSAPFTTQSDFDLYTVIDNNADGNTWKYYSTKKCVQYYGGTKADEWLVTPRLALKASKAYKLSFDTWLESATSANIKTLKVTIGKGATVADQTKELWNDTVKSTYQTKKEVLLSVTEDGNWNIGFNCYDKTSFNSIFLSNISVEEIDIVPAAVEDLAITPGEQGNLSALITWTNSSLSTAGNTLSSLEKVEVYRGQELLYTKENPTVGEAETYTDNTVPEAGKFTYKIIGYSASGAGAVATIESGWIGNDTPKPVTDVLLVDEDGKAKVTFTAPTEGIHGGWINVADLKYKIVRNPGNITMGSDLTETTFVDDTKLGLGSYTYIVTSIFSDLESSAVVSNAVSFGDALKLPYETSFPESSDLAIWTIVDINNDGTWAYNNTKKEVGYTTTSKKPNDWLFTPPFNTVKGSHTFSFFFKTGAYNSKYTEQLKITLGTSPDPAQHTIVLADYPDLVSLSYFIEKSLDFTIPEDGKWYIGLHLYTNDPWGFYINKAKIVCNELILGLDASETGKGIYYNSPTQSLEITSANIKSLQVFNIAGTLILSAEHPTTAIQLSELTAGVYVVHYQTTDGASQSFRILKK